MKPLVNPDRMPGETRKDLLLIHVVISPPKPLYEPNIPHSSPDSAAEIFLAANAADTPWQGCISQILV